jgi:hypothetical protein
MSIKGRMSAAGSFATKTVKMNAKNNRIDQRKKKLEFMFLLLQARKGNEQGS